MDMTKDVFEFLEKKFKENIVFSLDGRQYFFNGGEVKKLKNQREDFLFESLCSNSISSIVDYINCNVNNVLNEFNKLVIHIESPKRVVLLGEANNLQKTYDELVICEARNGCFNFNIFMDTESFIINLMCGFEQDNNAKELQKVASSICSVTEFRVDDNGVSQNAIVKSGTALKKNISIQNPVWLKPFRTFSEIKQPSSPFIFRTKESGNGITCALHKTSECNWEVEAVNAIRGYFKEHIEKEKADKVAIIG